jgi:hypothetical protein
MTKCKSKKAGGKPKSKTGEEAWQAFAKAVKKASGGVIPTQPFLYGYMYNLDRNYAARRNMPLQVDLTDKQKGFISKFVGLPFSGHKTYLMLLRKRLAEKFPAIEQRLEKMTWDEILVYVWDAVKAVNEAIQPKAETAKNVSAEANAIAILIDNPEWSNTRIAKEAGIYRTTLYDFPKFMEARRLQKEEGKKSLPGGSKDGETGTMEAWER